MKQPNACLWKESIPGGCHWSGIVRRVTTLRLLDVAGGANACVLHYVQNDAMLNAGEVVLIDAGCELDGYASDITRTFPVSGKFSGPQRDIYQLVLAAQAAALAEVAPGAAWNAPHDAAVRVLARGFIEFRLCQGSVDKVIETGDQFLK